MEKAPELLVQAPTIEKIDVLADKLPVYVKWVENKKIVQTDLPGHVEAM